MPTREWITATARPSGRHIPRSATICPPREQGVLREAGPHSRTANTYLTRNHFILVVWRKRPEYAGFARRCRGGPGRGALVAAGEKRPNALKIARRRAGGERCKQQGKLFTTEKRERYVERCGEANQ
ncbi:predicted protein [Histoplasma capsulatum var. duboisii H88]|uniref:Predicted protein n=1 Tax=Ajellomyces capsulatus (strain H88) TaxID=544711 RepID=F0UG85_AJEC8|nr:predicted protein [Histoplasma capsulatum var. duboisii H88]QSS55847.1 hypothetical protein I7I53_03843 [Histoplasma capsulatum var. duboisii H88]